MFGRKPPTGDTPQPAPAPATPQPAAARPAMPPIPARPAPAAGADSDSDSPTTATVAPRPAMPATPAPARRPAEPIRAEAAGGKDLRKLQVGRDITLSGELVCDHLMVEGVVEARVKECQRLEIAETGLFRGTVEIQEADIGGRFEGEIIVQGRLNVRATGRIDGKISYGELAVEAGGLLDGEIHTVGNRKAMKAAAKPAEPLPFDPNPPSPESAMG